MVSSVLLKTDDGKRHGFSVAAANLHGVVLPPPKNATASVRFGASVASIAVYLMRL